jgi:hypothetical protein
LGQCPRDHDRERENGATPINFADLEKAAEELSVAQIIATLQMYEVAVVDKGDDEYIIIEVNRTSYLCRQFEGAYSIQPIRSIPEPGTLSLFAADLIALGFMRRRRHAVDAWVADPPTH